MVAKLTVYNLALLHLGECKLATIDENREPRRVLDDFWDTVTGYGLAQGMWDFAMPASATLTETTAAFNFARGWTIPAETIYLFSAADNPGFNPPIDRDFLIHNGVFYGNAAQVYARITSSTTGMELTRWPAPFSYYISATLARAACMRLTGSVELLAELQRLEDMTYMTAFAGHSQAMLQGMLPFNAVAFNEGGSDAAIGAQQMLPFPAYHAAAARLSGPRQQSGGD